LPFGSGPSAVGKRAEAVGGSTSLAITAASLCAISCAKVSDTAEQNGHARATVGTTARQTTAAICRNFLMELSLSAAGTEGDLNLHDQNS
jgi:hypothetical protein